ncbi:hypothetical protein [Actinomadura rubrisoli]|uniref:Uncharacterized protein n=1 Tax=Actinomadura rubrisoli TaxID=2530368 RepID=A0A4R5BDM0_9ACTN|nr:hypothetical protein [Actinomadura rubrisoli]TDD84311.1 hypothetical protein E1298_20125 [Actinomadura rubrisoli]
MTGANAEEFAEFGAAALDSFKALFEQAEHLDHRNNDDHARELIGDLLIDLMHYSEQRNLEFDDIVAEAQGYFLSEQNNSSVFSIGSTIQLEGPAADEAILLGQPTRGSLTGLLVPNYGPVEYYVHFLGETSNRKVLAADLEPAPPFPTTPTTKGIIDDPLKAEEALIETMTRIGRADLQGARPQTDDLRHRQALLSAVATWNNMKDRDIIDLLMPQVTARLPIDDAKSQPESPPEHDSPAPGQLAAQAFPVPLCQGLPSQPPEAPTTVAARPVDAPPKRSSATRSTTATSVRGNEPMVPSKLGRQTRGRIH